jgi:hypothetical protein
MIKLSLIVSSFDRPEALRLCIQSLALQRGIEGGGLLPHFAVTVTDNSPDKLNQWVTKGLERGISPAYFPSTFPGPYEPSERIITAGLAKGEYLGFPSDDNWYAPEYVARMIRAAEENDWDLVYSDCIYDPRWLGVYSVMEAYPKCGMVDKGGFIVRQSLFLEMGGWPKIEGGLCHPGSDGLFVEAAAARCKHGRVAEPMWFHG